jgi:hypothetical protein
MSTGAAQWEIDEVDPSCEPGEPVRAKPLGRRVPAAWHEQDGVWHATVGGWAVRVGQGATWEWSAFHAGPRSGPRALRCTGFAHREAAQRDAEATLGG